MPFEGLGRGREGGAEIGDCLPRMCDALRLALSLERIFRMPIWVSRRNGRWWGKWGASGDGMRIN